MNRMILNETSYFGAGCISAIIDEAKSRRFNKALVVTDNDLIKFGVADKEIVNVKLSTPRALVFGDVVVRVSDKFAPAMHIDTDEANAAAASGVVYGEIVK